MSPMSLSSRRKPQHIAGAEMLRLRWQWKLRRCRGRSPSALVTTFASRFAVLAAAMLAGTAALVADFRHADATAAKLPNAEVVLESDEKLLLVPMLAAQSLTLRLEKLLLLPQRCCANAAVADIDANCSRSRCSRCC